MAQHDGAGRHELTTYSAKFVFFLDAINRAFVVHKQTSLNKLIALFSMTSVNDRKGR